MSAPAAKLIGVALAKRNKPSVEFWWVLAAGTREWLTLTPYRPVRGDSRLRAVISQDVHFADIFNAISPAEHPACSANLYG